MMKKRPDLNLWLVEWRKQGEGGAIAVYDYALSLEKRIAELEAEKAAVLSFFQRFGVPYSIIAVDWDATVTDDDIASARRLQALRKTEEEES